MLSETIVTDRKCSSDCIGACNETDPLSPVMRYRVWQESAERHSRDILQGVEIVRLLRGGFPCCKCAPRLFGECWDEGLHPTMFRNALDTCRLCGTCRVCVGFDRLQSLH
ncbi:hypothetical protein AVEN_105783-1 [Araneus ventricosus]|uniref:Uncharacterized protein n=1 Tax=Araneus ventricosus TaxID=182803 RepID=A0A4Y2G4V8_ARAVE|nr:hypothetical protein AVEN_105783-1 [Araneus ventricosus]